MNKQSLDLIQQGVQNAKTKSQKIIIYGSSLQAYMTVQCNLPSLSLIGRFTLQRFPWG
jgi:hypothetical protein